MADGVVWSVSEDGIIEFDRFLDHAIAESRDMTSPLEDSQDYVQSMILEEFLSDGERSGGWQALNHDYDLWKIGHGQYFMLQLDSEFLRDAGTPENQKMMDVLLSDSAWSITPDDAIFSPDSSRAAWHQEGAVRSKGGVLPARPWLFFTEFDYEEIETIFENWSRGIFLDPAYPGSNVGRSTLGTFLRIGPYFP